MGLSIKTLNNDYVNYSKLTNENIHNHFSENCENKNITNFNAFINNDDKICFTWNDCKNANWKKTF